MKFYGKGKQSFADEGGLYFSARFVDGVYETHDKTEIELMKRAGWSTRKGKKDGSIQQKKDK